MTITPRVPASTIRRLAARTQRKVPVRVMSRTRLHCSSVISSTDAVPPRPALLTITSTPPKGSAASRSAATWASSVTSQGTAVTRSAPNSVAEGLLGLGEPPLVGVAEHDGLGALLQAAAHGRGADPGSGGGGHDDHLAGEQVVARDVGRRRLLGSWRSLIPVPPGAGRARARR